MRGLHEGPEEGERCRGRPGCLTLQPVPPASYRPQERLSLLGAPRLTAALAHSAGHTLQLRQISLRLSSPCGSVPSLLFSTPTQAVIRHGATDIPPPIPPAPLSPFPPPLPSSHRPSCGMVAAQLPSRRRPSQSFSLPPSSRRPPCGTEAALLPSRRHPATTRRRALLHRAQRDGGRRSCARS